MYRINRKYVLITPAKNEEAFIEGTIQAVVMQTILPLKWIIVSDHSTDRTCEIVERYQEKYPFLELLRLNGSPERDYASKVRAFNSGYRRVRQLDYAFIGNLDADISFGSDYYERIIREFEKDPRLGIAGGFVVEKYRGKEKTFTRNLQSVGCAIQFFRRECFEQIGGYLPLKMGGEDAVAENMAKMRGWTVRTFRELKVYHHRPMGTGNWSRWKARFNQGREEYLLGYHPVFFFLKTLSRITHPPFLLGSLLTLLGYGASVVKRERRPVPGDFVRYLRRGQKQRMLNALKVVGHSLAP